jgi:ribosomal protein S18 acetylase RimI-like enzyme
MPAFDVSPASPHELLPACRLLFPDGRAEHSRDRVLSEPNGRLFVARAGGKLRAAALVQALPGALGVALPPRGDSADATAAVTAVACAWLRERGVKVCQAFAAAGDAADMAPLARAGFVHTTQLVMLRHDLAPSTLPPLPRERFCYCPERPPFTDEFRGVLLATHEGSLDCPELNASRTRDELLAGFAEPSPLGSWNLVRRDGEAVGIVIGTADAASNVAELSYFGVIPAERGRGVASRLLCQSLHAASSAGFAALTVSVDARNTPAMRLYARHGFAEYDRRGVWLLTQSR